MRLRPARASSSAARAAAVTSAAVQPACSSTYLATHPFRVRQKCIRLCAALPFRRYKLYATMVVRLRVHEPLFLVNTRFVAYSVLSTWRGLQGGTYPQTVRAWVPAPVASSRAAATTRRQRASSSPDAGSAMPPCARAERYLSATQIGKATVSDSIFWGPLNCSFHGIRR